MKKLASLFQSIPFNIAFISAIAVLAILLTLKDNPEALLVTIKNADWRYILFIAFLVICIRILAGMALKIEANLEHPKYTWFQGFVNSCTAGLFNGITPSSSGGQFAQAYIFRRQGIPLHSSASILWMDFIVYQTTMILTVFLLLILRLPVFIANYSKFFWIVLAGFLVNASVITGAWAMIRFPKFYTWLTTKGLAIGAKLHIVKDKDAALKKLNTQLDRFNKETKILSSRKDLIVKIALCHFIRTIIYHMVPFFCARALHIPLGWDHFLDTIALSSFVEMINTFIPLPGSSGGTEATFMLMFSTILNRSQVSSIMLLWRFMTYYFVLLFGAVMFIYGKTAPAVPITEEENQADDQKAEDSINK